MFSSSVILLWQFGLDRTLASHLIYSRIWYLGLVEIKERFEPNQSILLLNNHI